MNLRAIILPLCAATMLAGCSTTTLDRTEIKRGPMLQDVTGDFRLIDEKIVLEVGESSVQLSKRRLYEQQNEKHYQLIERKHYTTEKNLVALTSTLFVLCLPYVIITFGALDCSLPSKVSHSHYSDMILAGKQDVDSTAKSRTENVAIANSQVDIFVGNIKAKSDASNAQGNVYYALDRLLVDAHISPQRIVNGDGIEVRATSSGVSASYRFPNKAVPESFFAQSYEEEKTTLLEANRARHDNCSLVSRNMREFYECYFQRNLLGG